MAIKDSLTRYVGPLPVWGWLALVAAALYLWKRHEASASSSTGTSSGALSSLLGSGSSSASTGTGSSAASSDATDSDTSGETNDSWADSAIQYLEGQGYNQSQAQAAIGTYTSGGTLDPSMATLVDSAVQGVGQPPSLILPTSTTPALPTPTAPGTGTASSTTSAGAGSAVGSSGSSASAPPTTMQSLPAYVLAHQSAYSQAGANYVSGGPKDSTGHQAYFKYTVKKGDTIATLGSKFGSGAKQIEAWNKVTSIKPGQTIWV
jgi:LysM repeat protein